MFIPSHFRPGRPVVSCASHLRTLPVLILLAGVVVVPMALAQPVPQYHLEIVDRLPGYESMYPKAMTDNGAIITGIAGSDPWDPLCMPVANRPGTTVELEKLTNSLNLPLGVGKPGLIVGTSSYQPAAWVNGKAVFLKAVNGMPNGFAYDANEKGIIGGTVYNDWTGREFPIIWPTASANGLVLPGLGGSKNGVVHALNEHNQAAGTINNVGGYNFVAVRWDRPDRRPKFLGMLPDAINSEVVALNELGDAVGRSSFADNTVEAMAYFESTQEVVGLGHLGGTYSFANDINDAQQVVGTSSTAIQQAHAFLWIDGTLYDLNDLIVSSSEPFDYVADAVAIDDQGRIAVETVVTSGFSPQSRIGRLIPQ